MVRVAQPPADCTSPSPQDTLRPSWQSYYLNVHAVVLVIDSTDRERLPQVKAEMVKLLVNVDLAKAVFLILANKQVSSICCIWFNVALRALSSQSLSTLTPILHAANGGLNCTPQRPFAADLI